MIFPNSAKDRETAAYPYVELFRDFYAAVCRPNNTLVTYGYSFGDEHINRVIEDMLTIPSTHLVIISYNDPMGRIMKTYNKVARPAQTTLLIGNHLGGLKNLVDRYLPKPAIDRTIFRMAELLKALFGTEQAEKSDKDKMVKSKRRLHFDRGILLIQMNGHFTNNYGKKDMETVLLLQRVVILPCHILQIALKGSLSIMAK